MSGTNLDWFPLYAETFLASKANAMMTAEQFGMFLRLLMREWVDGPLPTDAQALLRLCSGNAQALPGVLVWFRETPDGYVNDRLEELRKDAEDRIQLASDKGRKGAKSRWGNRKRDNARALPGQCVGMSQAMPNDGSIHLPLHLHLEEEESEPPAAAGPAAPKPAKVYPIEAVRAYNVLVDLMLGNNPKAKIPAQGSANEEKWTDAINKLNRIDGYDWSEIMHIIEWCQFDAFWRANILSGPKLREKFGQLKLTADRPATGSRTANNDAEFRKALRRIGNG